MAKKKKKVSATGGASISVKSSKKSRKSTKQKKKLTAEQKRAQKEYRESLRRELIERVEEANKRISQLIEEGLSDVSPAFKRAYESLPSYRKGDNAEIFRTDLRTENTLQREIARVDQFLGDWSSSVEGSAYYNTERLKGAFGGQWLAETGETFDTSRIDKDFASIAFSMYDKLAEKYQSEDRLRMLWNKDAHTQDSDKLIMALYSMVEEGVSEEDVFQWASTILDRNYSEMLAMSQRQFMSYDYGRL